MYRVCDVMSLFFLWRGGEVERKTHGQGLKVKVINDTKLLRTNISPPKGRLNVISYINKWMPFINI